ncbi:DNA-dependent protein kinase subunit [Dictyostelium discoideum AX4]|uniref:DNA-dependent protein kinase catalytic subunit n=1 Tax=Dictyostelium discoideum TaxID=44689 RepID=PRKDC_DICDI|nr:DNA-dependent protein kinase subunit [Dictyostelium discoideum AX4]Q54UC0.2 RecName: Full=DNA-dependent protein kinase catalytic subunit; Short=DNA-PK catalytic subunit; Short=DNA-PKcs [Dictyostelium discoideum]EAL66880.2 DNA-dependent protein kinase subunit [Dictyostelium discoideum AX4]|eukprot:XP_640856.2 DNA-dependent protein kinase subunit [Dictyostelium discoideum AX4]
MDNIYQRIENYLIKLFQTISETNNNNNNNNTNNNVGIKFENDLLLVNELGSIILKELVLEEEIGLVASLLFTGDHSLLKYLEKSSTISNKENVKIKVSILNLIAEFIEILQVRTDDYAIAIKNTCVLVFRKDQSHSVQAAAFGPIKKILHLMSRVLKQGSIVAESFGVSEMTQLFLLQFTCGKLTQTVRGEIIVVLGLFTEYFSSNMCDRNQQLSFIFMETLGGQLRSKSPESTLIQSCLKGLNSLLVHFSGDFIASDPKNVQLIYQYVYICLDPASSTQRFEIPRAAMKIVARHAVLLRQYLAEHSQPFYTRIEHWCNHINKLNRDIAFTAVDSFFQQISKELTSGNRSLEADQSTFKFFIRKFYSIFENNNSSRFELSIAIRGCGRFASPVKSFMGEWELKSLLNSLFKFSEKLMVVKIENIDEITLHLSSFINAFACILYELNELEFWYLDHIEQVLETYFIIFPHLFVKSRDRYFKAVNRLISSLFYHGEYLKILLSRFVKKGLLITFSKPNDSIKNLITTANTPFYQVYKDLWYNLLNPTIDTIDKDLNSTIKKENNNNNNNKNKNNNNNQTLTKEEISKSIKKLVYDEIVSSILSIIKKLDLQYQKDENDNNSNSNSNNNNNNDQDNNKISIIEYESEINQLKPVTSKDIELFLGLVEFFKLFISKYNTELFVQWIYIFGKEMISFSKKYPLISGFYKLVQIVMQICKSQKYFNELQQDDNINSVIFNNQIIDEQLQQQQDIMDIDDTDNNSNSNNKINKKLTNSLEEDKNNCFILFKKYIKEVSNFISHYKDELLSSCIELLLSLPKQLISIPLLVPIANLAFQYGISYLPLAHVGLNAIEYWNLVVPDQVHKHLDQLLPSLNDYLKISTNSSDSTSGGDIDIDSGGSMGGGGVVPPPSSSSRHRKMKFKSNSSLIDPKQLQFKTSIEDLQNRIIRLLGQLGGDNVHFLGKVSLVGEEIVNGVAWDTEPKVLIKIPFADQNNIDIYLDVILPNVVNLAEKSPNRQIKVAAGELLHSVLLMMIGNSANQSQANQISYSRLYRKIFPSLICLSTDVEQVTKQLFQPLVFQMIHWFTRNKKQESDDTMNLLNAIVDAVGNPLDGARRDFAGQCLCEFAKWSLKNTSVKQQEKNAFNFKSILKRIYSLAHHPDPYKRLGAAISFNQLYRIFREEDSLVDQFIFEILHNIFFSLRIGDDLTNTSSSKNNSNSNSNNNNNNNNNSEDGTEDSIVEIASKYSNVLAALTKVIIKRADMLNKPSNTRREHKDLSQFVQWVFQNGCSRTESIVRYESMILFTQLVTLLPNIKTPLQWVKERIKSNGIQFIVSIAEQQGGGVGGGSSNGNTSLGRIPKIEIGKHKDIEFWFRNLSTSLNIYLWFFSEGFFEPIQILTSREFKSSLLSSAFHTFTTQFSMLNFNSNLKTNQQQQQQQVSMFSSMTPKEIDQFNRLKCNVITNLFGLYILLLEKYKFEQVIDYGGVAFVQLLVKCLMDPQSVGFVNNYLEEREVELSKSSRQDIRNLMSRTFKFPPLLEIINNIIKLLIQIKPKYNDILHKELMEYILPNNSNNNNNSSSSGNNKSMFSLIDIRQLINTEGTDRLIHLIHSYQILYKYNLLDSILLENYNEQSEQGIQDLPKSSLEFSEFIFDYLFNNCENLSPSKLLISKELIQLALTIGIKPIKLLSLIINPNVQNTTTTTTTTSTTTTTTTTTTSTNNNNDNNNEFIKDIHDIFYKTLFTEINNYISNNFQLFLPLLANRIIETNQIHKVLNDVCIMKQQQQPNRGFKDIIESIVLFLNSISEWTLNSNLKLVEKENIIEFTKNLIKIDPIQFFENKHCYEFVYNIITNYLCRSNPLTFKNKVLVLLPYLLSYPKHNNFDLIKQKLNEIVVYDFPLNSKDLTVKSPIYNEYITCIERLLETFELTKNPLVIDTLLHVLKETDHTHINYINLSIERSILSTNDIEAKEIFSHCFELFLNHYDELKITLIDKFCVPLISHMKENILVQIFSQHLSSLMSIIQPLQPKYLSDSQERKSSIIEKICCFHLIEALYQSLPSAIIKEKINPFFYDKPDGKGTELTAAIMKAAHSAKSEKLTSDDKYVTRSLCTKYHGAAFSALASVIVSTQTKENFFHVFFFKENKDKNEYLWENIIDTDQVFNFQPETNFLVSYSTPQSLFANDLRYLSSQYLVDSSLSQDFIAKNFLEGDNNSTTNNNNGDDGIIMQGQSQSGDNENQISNDIEIDQVNSNPSMIAMLKIIDFYQKKFVVTPPSSILFGQQSQQPKPTVGDMPKWMFEIYQKLQQGVHPNIVIFMIKIIINRPQYFERFHELWIPILMDYVVSEGNGGNGLHYFVRDVCFILLKWPNIYKSQDGGGGTTLEKHLSKFVNHLMKNTYCTDRRILKSNLNIVKSFVERWKSLFKVDKSIILELLSTKGDFKSKSRQIKTTGLVLLSILLSNGYPAYDKEYDSNTISEFKFYQVLLDHLQDFKELYDAASEVCGMILLYLSKQQQSQQQQQQSIFPQLLKDKINSILNNNENQRAFSCLYFIGLHYPLFLQGFYGKIFNLLPQISNETRLIALNIIHWCVEDIQDLYTKLKSNNIENLIRIREGEIQVVILRILYKLVQKRDTTFGTVNQILSLLLSNNWFTSNVTNEYSRSLYYDIIIYIYNNFIEYQDQSNENSKDLVLSLLIGLSDESDSINKKLLQFWDNNSKTLSASSNQRLQQFFDIMYSPETESKWVANSCCLLFQLCNRSSDFTKLLFDKPLSECTFKEVQVDSSWQHRTLNMNPLFSSSQYGIDDATTDESNGDSMQLDEIRATQAPNFTLTQTAFSEFYPSSSQSYGGTNNNTGSSQLSSSSSSSGSQSSSQNNSSSKRKQKITNDPKLINNSELRRRFKKIDDRGADERIVKFARLQVKRNIEREAYFEKSKQARENQITMIRKYRVGELPDIQIKLQDIIKPLQLLCQRDSTIGVNVFSSLFTALYKNTPKESIRTFQCNIKKLIDSIVERCKFNSTLVSSILNISEKNLEFSPEFSKIKDISLNSNNHPMAIILCEKLILSLQNTTKASTTNQAQKLQQQQQLNQGWDSLRELYKSLKEDDIIMGLIEKQMGGDIPYTKKALEFELKGDWVNVLKVYDEATSKLESGELNQYQGNLSESETALWENGRLECFTKLCNWSALKDNFNSYYPNPNQIFKEKNCDLLLSYFFEFNLKVKENWNYLYQFIADLANTKQYQYLENKFPGELAFLEVTRSDHNKASYYVSKFYQAFKHQWSSSHPLAIESRHRILQPLQKIVEVEEFLNLTSTPIINTLKLDTLLTQWKSRFPTKLDDIMVWDDLIFYRSVLLEKIYERFSSFTSDKSSDEKVKSTLIQERAILYHKMSKGARKLGNIVVSEIYFRQAVKSYPKTKDNDLAFPLVTSLIDIYCTKARNSPSPIETLDRFVKALKFIESKKDEESIINSNENLQKYLMMHGDIFWDIYQLDKKLGSTLVIDSFKKNSLPINLTSIPINSLKDELFNSTFKCYSESIKLHQKSTNLLNTTSSSPSLSISSSSSPYSSTSSSSQPKLSNEILIEKTKTKSAHLKFANFCDNILKDKISQQTTPTQFNEEVIDLATSVIVSTLEAIKEEIPGSVDKFPRLLEILTQFEQYSVIAREFKSRVSTIPCWMFIRWISQMFPYLDLPQGPLILPILLEIAKWYPQAIYFPFKISSEQFGPLAKKISAPLEKELINPLLDTLVIEFQRLTHPEHRFKDYMEEMKSLIKATPKDLNAIAKLNNEIYDDSFNPSTVSGDYNLKFAKEHEASYLSNFGKDSTKLARMDQKKFLEIFAEMSGNMNKNMKPNSTASMKLKDFSGWLADFDRSNYQTSHQMEIPGQYDGIGKPQPETHVTISSFDTNVLVMGSLRKPKRVKIHGNDELDYPFLIKGGEDLRLDQRIQQLFGIMNEILKRDTACNKRSLNVTTYQVVPMTSKVGIIEWLNDTKPLREILEEQLAHQLKTPRSNVSISKLESTKYHNDWINSFAKYLKPNSPVGPLYQQMFIHATRDDCAKKLEKQHSKVPENLLQNGIWSLSSSPESYLFIRNSFARSLASFSVCSYVIGIGDRHLENFLISQRDGRLIGIDFGHAFGTATQFLPIPELMPFRLTRQFTSFLRPLDSVGLLNHNMTYTLTALQNQKEILLTTMDVFVKEPLLDWSKLATRLVKEQGKHPKDTKNVWFPKQKIQIAKKKLELVNPAYITLEELSGSVHSGLPYEKALSEIIKGDPKHNIRAKVNKVCSSVKEQIDCLIDQSTDPNILSRAWVGWNGAL